ncbi:MAG: hypothetical protein JXA95_15750 [Spirochaetales bacterium]|nr:hypothetical protein [Spirochaetales bacterium]
MILLLILYTSLPALLITLYAGLEGPGFYAGLALFLIQGTGEFLLIRSRNRERLVSGGILLFVALSAYALYTGLRLQEFYLPLFIHLYPGPVLTMAYVVIYKISRPRDFEKLSPGFSRIIILLFSYAVLLFMLALRQMGEAGFPGPGKDMFYSLYGALNFLPPIYFLNLLRNNSQKRVFLDKGRIWLRNEEITPLFSRTELALLDRAFAGDGRIRCSDAADSLNREEPGSPFLCRPGECKASLCLAYSAIYRHIKSLDRKMENLGLGMLMPPENKRDITIEGWLFIRDKEMRIMKKKVFPLRIPAVSLPGTGDKGAPAGSGKRFDEYVFSLSIALAGSSALLSEGFALAGKPLSLPSLITLTLAAAALLLLPLEKPKKKKLMVLPVLIVLLPFLLLGSAGEEQALTLSLKSLVLFIACFLSRFPYFEEHSDPESLRERAPNALFWLIWFYMIIISLFTEPAPLRNYPFLGNPGLSHVTQFSDHLLLFLLFFLSARFFSLSRKPLKMTGDAIEFNGRTLPLGQGKTDREILRGFILRRDEPYHCYEILNIVEPGKESCAKEHCKPSSCPSYQKIYKRIRTIRKYLQTTGIGTIVSPERKAASHREGWRLILFDDVYITDPD